MVDVAQLVEHRIVAPMVVGSNPIVHPNFFVTTDCYQLKKLDDSELNYIHYYLNMRVFTFTNNHRKVVTMSYSTPHDIRVEVETMYVDAQSDPEDNRYVFAYTITIRNVGALPARLLRRHWLITDANGKIQEVYGEGVVGEQPYLRPGEGFRYTSATMIETPVGSMQGRYQLIADDGQSFYAEIPPFSLALPHTLH